MTIQGELVDRIEYHVETTKNHVSEGHVQLKAAESYQSKARKVRRGVLVKVVRHFKILRDSEHYRYDYLCFLVFFAFFRRMLSDLFM